MGLVDKEENLRNQKGFGTCKTSVKTALTFLDGGDFIKTERKVQFFLSRICEFSRNYSQAACAPATLASSPPADGHFSR
jgi:hypothetical protein